MHTSTRLALPVLLALALGCAHTRRSSGLEGLKPIAESFFDRVRWRDFRSAAELIVPERRASFERARNESRDERDLTISEYQIERAELAGEGGEATVVARMSWTRLPSVTENTAVVRSKFTFREGAWLLQSQDGGPFPDLQPAGPSRSAE